MSSMDTYDSYAQSTDVPRFTDWLRTQASEPWEAMLDHRFVHECTNGTISDAVFETYLEQEYAFVETSTTALGYAVAQAPSMQATRHLAEALHGLVTDQFEYFEETFDALGVTGWQDPNTLPATTEFRDFFVRAAADGGYVETLSSMLAAEWLYATWCRRAADAASFDPTSAVGQWVLLHEEGSFQRHAEWLREELDRRGPELPPRRQRDAASRFGWTLEHERRFHTAPYEASEGSEHALQS